MTVPNPATSTWNQVAVREELGPERGTTKFLLQLQDLKVQWVIDALICLDIGGTVGLRQIVGKLIGA